MIITFTFSDAEIMKIENQKNNLIPSELIEPCDIATGRCVPRVRNLRSPSGRYTDSKVALSFPIHIVGNILE